MYTYHDSVKISKVDKETREAGEHYTIVYNGEHLYPDMVEYMEELKKKTGRAWTVVKVSNQKPK